MKNFGSEHLNSKVKWVGLENYFYKSLFFVWDFPFYWLVFFSYINSSAEGSNSRIGSSNSADIHEKVLTGRR